MKLIRMVDCCMNRDYIGASKIYFELAIGNAPWPVGVTASGIHERAGQTKIHEHEVARNYQFQIFFKKKKRKCFFQFFRIVCTNFRNFW